METISSRTPEGFPSECPLCGARVNLEFSDPGKDATCPQCGCLVSFSANVMRRIQDYLARATQLRGHLSPDDPILPPASAEIDSLEIVELIMEFEEEFDIQIPDDAADSIQTWGDFVRLLEQTYRDRRE
jgi:acyl carrier protein